MGYACWKCSFDDDDDDDDDDDGECLAPLTKTDQPIKISKAATNNGKKLRAKSTQARHTESQ